MSYQVIARKWRPPTFSKVIGQDHISQTLINALKGNRLPHALLFTGPRGTGKTSSARILAKSLRCINPQGVVPCNNCHDCTEINKSSSVNVIEIDGASNNGVESIRELRNTVSYKPSTGQYKVYIIDEVHMLSTSAFNALLKTLEEPPPYIVFVMATTEAHKIPHTILSRCQRFDFRRVPTATIAKSLIEICQAEGVPAEKEALWALARQADGSMRDGQSLLDQVITFSDLNITYQKVIEVLGLTDRHLLISSLEALVQQNTSLMIETVENITTSGLDPKVFVQELLMEIRHLLIAKLSPEKCENLIDLPQSEIEQLKTFSEQLTPEDLHLLFDMGLRGADDIPRATDPQLVLEMLMLRMVAAPRSKNSLKSQTIKSLPPRKQTPTRERHPIPTRELSSSPTSSPTRKPSSSLVRDPPSHPKERPPTPTRELSSSSPAREQASPHKTEFPSSLKTPSPPSVSIKTPSKAFSSIEKKWADLVTKVKEMNPIVGVQLSHSYLAKMDDKNLVVGIPPHMKFLHEPMKSQDFQKKLGHYITTFWGPGFQITIQVGDETVGGQIHGEAEPLTPSIINQQKAAKRSSTLRREVEDHPLVKSAQSIFKTKKLSIEEPKATCTKETP